jgi:hypothetical protein
MSKMSSREALDGLLTALSEHDIPLTRKDVAWAFESRNSREVVTQWVNENLHSDTLLTKDELAL